MTISGGLRVDRTPEICTIVLAAGRSSRMAGAHKLLEEIEGRSVLAWSLDAARRAALGPIVVVTGHRASEVEALVPPDISHVRNPDWADGMSTSLRVGLATLAPRTAAVAVALGDMPAVRDSHYRMLADAWSPGRIVLPVHGGVRGHPVIWPGDLVDGFSELRGDVGAKPLLRRHADAVVEVPAEDPGVILDVDDPGDLARARERLRDRVMSDPG